MTVPSKAFLRRRQGRRPRNRRGIRAVRERREPRTHIAPAPTSRPRPGTSAAELGAMSGITMTESWVRVPSTEAILTPLPAALRFADPPRGDAVSPRDHWMNPRSGEPLHPGVPSVTSQLVTDNLSSTKKVSNSPAVLSAFPAAPDQSSLPPRRARSARGRTPGTPSRQDSQRRH